MKDKTVNDNIQLKPISQKGFYDYWNSKKSIASVDESVVLQFFKPYVQALPKLVLGEYYWQIFNNAYPFPKILMVDGAVEKLTPITDEVLLNIKYDNFFSFFHPQDFKQTMTFVSKVFDMLFKMENESRQHFNFTIYSRIKNGEGQYLWNSIQYPALYFDEKGEFKYGMALYTNVNHLMKPDAVPMLTILDATNKHQQTFTCYLSDTEITLPKSYPTISKREKEIIGLLSQGKASKQICEILGIAKNTVDNHRQRLLKKFNVQSSAELVVKACIF